MKSFLLSLLLLPLLTFGQDAPTYYEEGSVPLRGDSKIILEHKIAGAIYNSLAELLDGSENVTTAPTYLSPGGPEPQQSDSEMMLLHRIAAGINSLETEIGTIGGDVAWGDITGKPTTVATSGLTDAVATARTISASGLATGGGDLSANRTITVTGASQAEAEAGTATTVVMTPQRTAQAIAALGGGGSAIEFDLVAWVETDGNNTTGTVGDPSKPYLTMSEAYDDGARVFYLGAGTFAGLTKSGAINIRWIGQGRGVTTITLIDSTDAGILTLQDLGNRSARVATIGRNGTAGADGSSPTAGSASSELYAYNVEYTTINLNGGNGGNSDTVDVNGANGGSAGSVKLYNCYGYTALNTSGGGGGTGGGGMAISGTQGGASLEIVGGEHTYVSSTAETCSVQLKNTSLIGGYAFASSGGSPGGVEAFYVKFSGGGSVGSVNLSGAFIDCDTGSWNSYLDAHGSLIAGTWQD